MTAISSDARLNHGVALCNAGRWQEAKVALAEYILQDDSNAQAFFLLGAALAECGETENAILQMKQALKLQPENLQYQYNMAVLLARAGQVDNAVARYRHLITQMPKNVSLWLNLSTLLIGYNRLEEAEKLLIEGTERLPAEGGIWNNLANLYRDRRKDFSKAESAYRKAEENNGGIEVWCNHADLLLTMHRYAETQALCQQALGLFPDCEALLLPRLCWAKNLLCDWSTHGIQQQRLRDLAVEDPATEIEPFQYMMSGCSESELFSLTRRYSERQFSSIAPLPSAARQQNDRIRVAYLSADFHDHPTMHLMGDMMAYHDRTRFQVIAYALDPDDASPHRAMVKRSVDHFVRLGDFTDKQIAKRIQKDNVDILIDMKGYTLFARPGILAYRPAPVQIQWLGYPGTMGAPFIDYLIADAITVPPESETHYSEKILRLPHSYFVANYPSYEEILKTPLTEPSPDAKVILCAFHAAYKMDPAIFDVWMRILKAAPDAMLWLYAERPEVKENLLKEAAARGVGAERLLFAARVPKPQHLRRLAEAHLFLDASLCNAHTTAIDSLAAGVPVLTMKGSTQATRACESILEAIGMREMCMNDLAVYEARAIELAQNPSELKLLHERVLANRKTQPLFDVRKYVRELEKLLLSTSNA